MSIRTQTVLSIVSALLLSIGNLPAAPAGADDSDWNDLGTVQSWLPNYHSELRLIFSLDNNDRQVADTDSSDLHKAIDRVGPTITLIKARGPYDDEPRIIGGYNPYHWKTWTGKYERSPGKFIFDLRKEKRWFRNEPRRGSERKAPEEYGLSFGESDIVINPDLRSGTARNGTFASPENKSVLMGQAGPFLVESIRVYQVTKQKESYSVMEPIRQRGFGSPTPSSPVRVPDSGNLVVEGALAILAFWLLKHHSSRLL